MIYYNCLFYAINKFDTTKQKRRKCIDGNISIFTFTYLHTLFQIHILTYPLNASQIRRNKGRRQKIERTLTLQKNLTCVLAINKDYVLYVFVHRNDLTLGFDAVKKINQFFNSNNKIFAGSVGVAKIQLIPKKIVEFTSIMEQFLYTRQLTIRQYLNMMPAPVSKKKTIDLQIFNKFNHVNNQIDKKIIFESQLNASGIQFLELKKKLKNLQGAHKFNIRQSDQFQILQINQDRQTHLKRYKKNIIIFACCGKPKFLKSQTSQLIHNYENTIQQPLDIQQLEQTVLQRQKIKMKINEKLELNLQNAKIKQVLQYGQILIQGTTKQSGQIYLCDYQNVWSNTKLINKRITPSSQAFLTDSGSKIKFKTQNNYKSLPIIDYIIRKQSYTPEKVPLLFVYNREVSSSKIQFTFKYKINQKWKHRLYDIDISVILNKQFMVTQCKSVPTAYSLRNNKITWKTKEILPNSPSSKGKIILAFGTSNIAPKYIIKDIKITMRVAHGLLDQLRAECHQDWGYTSQGQKNLLIEYRISPNDQTKQSQNQ